MRRIAAAALIVALPLFGCGPKAIVAGSRPFPTDRAVFTDASGKPLSELPDSGEPLRLVVIDFPWCPPCADAWRSVRAALETAPPGSVRVYRILFDQETSISPRGTAQAPPLHPVPPPWPGFREDAGEPTVTTLTAIPGAFRERLRVNQAPALLLIGRDGTVARRWIGTSTNLGEELASELRKEALSPSAPPRK